MSCATWCGPSVGCVHPMDEPDMARFGAPRMALSVSHGAPQRGQGSPPGGGACNRLGAFDVRLQEPSSDLDSKLEMSRQGLSV